MGVWVVGGKAPRMRLNTQYVHIFCDQIARECRDQIATILLLRPFDIDLAYATLVRLNALHTCELCGEMKVQ